MGLRHEMAMLRQELRQEMTSLKQELLQDITLSEQRMTIRLGTIVSVAIGIAVTLAKVVG